MASDKRRPQPAKPAIITHVIVMCVLVSEALAIGPALKRFTLKSEPVRPDPTQSSWMELDNLIQNSHDNFNNNSHRNSHNDNIFLGNDKDLDGAACNGRPKQIDARPCGGNAKLRASQCPTMPKVDLPAAAYGGYYHYRGNVVAADEIAEPAMEEDDKLMINGDDDNYPQPCQQHCHAAGKCQQQQRQPRRPMHPRLPPRPRLRTSEMCSGPGSLVVIRLLSRPSEADMVCELVGAVPAAITRTNVRDAASCIRRCRVASVLVGGWHGVVDRVSEVYSPRRGVVKRRSRTGPAAVLCELI